MAARRKGLAFTNPEHSIALGIALAVAGSLLLYDGYERRGKGRPWALRFLPGP